jgi:hypothetical protein
MCEMEGARAGRDIKQIDKQIDTQRVRVRITEADIKARQESIKQSAATEAWYKSKYTNEALYAWMENTTRALCFDAYSLCIDLARKAEKAFQFERGPQGTTKFISPRGYWNNGHDGLLGAKSLLLDFRRIEIAYMDSSASDFEITKHISLRQVSLLALANLRMTGVAVFSLPESVFDFDFPGHYFRRIASVAVSIPCVTGPYTSLNCSMSLLEHSYRVSPLSAKGAYTKTARDDRFRTDRIPISSIALSQRSADSGVFELNFSRERYLPFENAGVISTWKLELPSHVRQFPYETISDVVLHLKYASRQGGAQLRAAAEQSVLDLIKAAKEPADGGDGLFAALDLANDFSNAWALARTADSNSGAVTIALGDLGTMFPYWTTGCTVTVQSVTLVAQCASKDAAALDITLLWGLQDEKPFPAGTAIGGMWSVREITECGADLSNWRIRVGGSAARFAGAVENMYLLIRYSAAMPDVRA